MKHKEHALRHLTPSLSDGLSYSYVEKLYHEKYVFLAKYVISYSEE